MEVVELQRESYEREDNVDLRSVPNELTEKLEDSSTSETEYTPKRKSRTKQLLDSDSDSNVNSPRKLITDGSGNLSDAGESDSVPTQHSKSRIKSISNSSDSDGKIHSVITQTSSRIHNRNKGLKSKFHNLLKNSKGHKDHINDNNENNSDSDSNANSPRKLTNDSNSSISNGEELNSAPSQHAKSRIKLTTNSSDSDSNSDSEITQTSSRIYNRLQSLKSKFDNLHKKSRGHKEHSSDYDENHSEKPALSDSDHSISTVSNKKKTQERNNHLKSTLYDTDTSEDETMRVEKPVKSKLKQKSMKMTSPKHIRMTAKQAMENMQKIKSESNRMLREKDVSLPYHRPKALALKDIMNKRKLAVAADGTTLPLKMNNEQLKQYEKMLQERQKEVIQLCKSDSEDENETDQNNEDKKTSVCESETEAGPKSNMLENKAENLGENVEKIAEDEALCEINKSVGEISEITPAVIDNNPTNTSIDKIENTNTDCLDTSDPKFRSESDSQLLCLHFDSERPNVNLENETLPPEMLPLPLTENIDTLVIAKAKESEDLICHENEKVSPIDIPSCSEEIKEKEMTDMDVDTICEKNASNTEHPFSDDDLNYEDIDLLIENAEIIRDSQTDIQSPALVTEKNVANMKPKLTGGPGMVIDLDGTSTMTKKMSGVELLKERFTFFAKLKTPDELERQRDKNTKPGMQFLKLKQDLELEMAEQRSLEWSKRLEQEKQLHEEMNSVLGETDETDIDKLEEKLLDDHSENDESSGSEEELIENDCDMEDKPRKSNPMLDDEAEESDVEDNNPAEANEDDNSEQENDDSENESSSESEVEEDVKPKKNRILKAFEDSDDEEEVKNDANDMDEPINKNKLENNIQNGAVPAKASQDEDIQLAQVHRSFSEDLFSTQESGNTGTDQNNEKLSSSTSNEKTLGTQSFSILHSTQDKFEIDKSQRELEELKAIANDIPISTQNSAESHIPKTQGFGDDVLALCTGNFYNNEFVTQDETKDNDENKPSSHTNGFEILTELPETEGMHNSDIVATTADDNNDNKESTPKTDDNVTKEPTLTNENKVENCDVLKSILNELDSPEFNTPKQKFFAVSEDAEKEKVDSVPVKKRFIIDSDDDEETTVAKERKLKKKSKRKRFEQRALQISDDEDDASEIQEDGESESEIEDDEERIVEYDSEENEVEIAPQVKKKRKTTDFFEQEAELTSEDEWHGSGDEDERNLDVMEREEGDDEVFHQGKLQRELGQIHMRDVMDQDKREVRIIQELLFEDGDLGDGHRQRKFRWKNIDGVEGDEGIINTIGESQEEDVENEAEWRKERHKREVFLRQMRKNDVNDISDLEITTTTILKSNLTSCNDIDKSSSIIEMAAVKEIPSPRKPLGVFQSNYHGSLLSKGESSLARLAALATPLNTDEDAPKTGLGKGKRNFVFSTLTQEEEDVKVTKRKADPTADSPRQIKKLKINNSRKTLKNSLIDHLSQ